MENSDVKAYHRKIERSYWIAVIHTDNWNKDDCIVKLAEKPLTRYILVSRPVYKWGHGYVYYAMFSFFLNSDGKLYRKKFWL